MSEWNCDAMMEGLDRARWHAFFSSYSNYLFIYFRHSPVVCISRSPLFSLIYYSNTSQLAFYRSPMYLYVLQNHFQNKMNKTIRLTCICLLITLGDKNHCKNLDKNKMLKLEFVLLTATQSIQNKT